MDAKDDRLVKSLGDVRFDDTPSDAHRDELEREVLAQWQRRNSIPGRRSPSIWRTKMTRRIAKLAAAAAVIAVAVTGICLLRIGPDAASVAWAVEDSIKAMGQVRTVHMKGMIAHKDFQALAGPDPCPVELWAQKAANGIQSEKVRLEIKDVFVLVSGKSITYKQIVAHNQVILADGGQVVLSPWPGPGLLEILKTECQDWNVTYNDNPQTGRPSVFVTCSYPPQSSSWWMEFDRKSNLLVRFKQWDNAKREGRPEFNIDEIVYGEDLPKEVFEFTVPAGADIVDKRSATLLADPGLGMSTEGLTQAEACARIVQDAWQAAIAKDWPRAGKLWIAVRAYGRDVFGGALPVELVEVGKPYQKMGCPLGPITPCTVKFDDGRQETWNMVVKFRQIDGEQSCLIAEPWKRPKTRDAD